MRGIWPLNGDFPSQRPVTQGFNVFFDVRLYNGEVSNRDAGDLRHHRAHCNVTITSFQEITIQHTQLKEVEPRAFYGLKKLQKLLLQRNKLTRVPELAPVKPTLITLNLSDNRLGKFSVDYFEGFVRLKSLYVACNQLIDAPSVGWLAPTLECSNLRENRITSLEGLTSQTPFPALRRVNLNENNIDELNVGILGKMPKLRYIKIAGNYITQIDDYLPFFPHTPNLHWNPFHCDESIAWISTKATEWTYSISQEICTRFLLCCALLWLYIDWFSHIHQAYFTGTVAI